MTEGGLIAGTTVQPTATPIRLIGSNVVFARHSRLVRSMTRAGYLGAGSL